MPNSSFSDPALTHAFIGLTPFEQPDAPLCIAICRAGALGVLDLGRDERLSRTALAAVASQAGTFGVRVPEGLAALPGSLPQATAAVVVASPADVTRFAGWRPTLAQVVSLDEARQAIAAGAVGLVAKGSEAGGRVGEETTFVLLQRLLAAQVSVPIWVQGGIGVHSAAAVRAVGARGVLVDSQLALVRESSAPDALKTALAAMDGSETVVIGGHRLFSRPDLPVAKLGAASPMEVRGRLGGQSLVDQLIPVGQDGALAAGMARRFRTAGGVVRGLTRQITSHLRMAQEGPGVGPQAPLAVAHGIRYPIAQGPMTRVSDRAAFAQAVAEGGGLPFLALSLLRGPEVERLIEETQTLLGERPFGVGILGFVPPDLRAEQLAVVERLRPRVALIAGGRPDQAKSLEALGITTYLHVPSPALLDLFLADGARSFVFEGRECGGHVGPRTSFVLWEQTVERLLVHPSPEELSLLFAGGIHDARSAAMVAALTAPLADRGAKVGVLLGTAYLFTEEAVASGAITPAFQKEALACRQTALLETAPGHATRCVETDFVREFRQRRSELEAAARPANEMWLELEQLNLGRLRIAAKGLRREGDALVSIDGEVQRREGMFMIGQVAAARTAVVSIAELHREVSEGSQRLLAALEIPPVPVRESGAVEVAIVGMAGIFPDAPDLRAFWSNVLAGNSAIREVDRSRWNPDIYFDPESQDGTKTPCKWGGFVPATEFDPLVFGVPPRSLAAIDPVQLLSLEVARRALADAGYLEREFDRERTSVIFGAEAGTDLSTAYGFRALYPQLLGPMPEALDSHLPTLSEDSFAGVLSNVIAGRIANRLDLGGVNYTVDAACASSLAAVDLAIKELASGQSEMVLCGGADLHNSINDYLMFASVHALSRRGRCATFDASADGIVLGEGVACLALKRLADAERDGDRIYAVIRGVGGSSDGRSLGLTAPRKEGQIRALERAYRHAGVSPRDIQLVEAHGTGTVVGDRTELISLSEVYQRSGVPVGTVTLGSVKSQIGHTKCAAGLAGLIKAALSLHHRILPPTLHVSQPNPAYEPAASPFVFSAEARPWLTPDGRARHAAVSAFGFGGTNFHAVLSEYARAEAPATGGARLPAELFLFRAPTSAEAARRAGALAERLARPIAGSLTDLAFTVSQEGNGPTALAIVARDLEDLRRKLERARSLTAGDGVYVAGGETGSLVFLFPGQGSQKPGMLRELFVAFPALHRLLELGRPWAEAILPVPGLDEATRDAQVAALTDTRVAQPALGVVELAALELLSSLGISPDLVGGHSYGELTALCAAGAITQTQLLALSAARASCILNALGDEPGTMAAVTAPLDRLRELCEGLDVTLVNENAPTQGVIAGTRSAVEAAIAKLAEHGIPAQRLSVACAFHSPLLAGADRNFAERLAAEPVHAPSLPVYSNTTAAPYPSEAPAIRALLSRQLVSPVRFAAQIEAMYVAGGRLFVEVGPGQVLTRLVGRVLGERPHLALPLARDGRPAIPQLLELVAELAVRGIPVQVAPLFAGRQAKKLDLQAKMAAPSPSRWNVDGHRAWPVNGELPAGSLRPNVEPLTGLAPMAPPAGREQAVLSFLQSMQQLADSQRDVMLRYLGAESGEVAARAIDVTPLAKASTNGVATRSSLPAPQSAADAQPQSESAATGGPSVTEALLALVSERTGYPAEMLNVDADLEAELSIDSIKRIEILGALLQKLKIVATGALASLPMEKLSALKTLRAIASFIEARLAEPGAPALPATSSLDPAEAKPVVAPPAALEWTSVRWLASKGSPNTRSLSGKRLWLSPEPAAVASALAERLRELGATPLISATPPAVAAESPLHGFIELAGLLSGPTRLWEQFARFREALRAGVRELWGLSATGSDRSAQSEPALPTGAGTAGLLRALAQEQPGLQVRTLDLDSGGSAAETAATIASELAQSAEGEREVSRRGGVRRVRQLASVVAPRLGVSLDESSVVLLSGGARGITAALAVALARRFHCHLELVGRRVLTAVEDPKLAEAADLPQLRKALLATGRYADLSAVEVAAQDLWAAREARRTLSAIAAAGGRATYHAVDLRDSQAVERMVGQIEERHGRLDAFFHGAGITEDRILADKRADGFQRVVDTKLASALAVLRHLKTETKLVVLFGSVSGVFGNRGQADYAAANDALDRLAWAQQGRFAGPVLALDFGPWAGAGMVTAELAREYERRGANLIPLEAGVQAVMDALFEGRVGQSSPAQLILTSGPATAFAGAASSTAQLVTPIEKQSAAPYAVGS